MAMNKAKELVSTNPVVVFSKTSCPFCVKVKQLLNQLGAKYTVVELDTESEFSHIHARALDKMINTFGNYIDFCSVLLLIKFI
ncbi:hypothetical protein H0E87_000849 [Populus deltoides]|uniref:Glutaredoxin domain-containing protein n=1 Tax=Populus deltoides TaxID=3696 RepID=A0A8T2ZR06_POPDE|nr:hypothetical protein H0E87_000849 [Populus deltoides]